jgi:hypothetical protein
MHVVTSHATRDVTSSADVHRGSMPARLRTPRNRLRECPVNLERTRSVAKPAQTVTTLGQARRRDVCEMHGSDVKKIRARRRKLLEAGDARGAARRWRCTAACVALKRALFACQRVRTESVPFECAGTVKAARRARAAQSGHQPRTFSTARQLPQSRSCPLGRELRALGHLSALTFRTGRSPCRQPPADRDRRRTDHVRSARRQGGSDAIQSLTF